MRHSCLSYSSIKNIRYILLSVLSDIEPASVLCVFVFSSLLFPVFIFLIIFRTLPLFVLLLFYLLSSDLISLLFVCLASFLQPTGSLPDPRFLPFCGRLPVLCVLTLFVLLTFILWDLTSLSVVNVRGMYECDRWAKATIFLITTTLSALWLLRWWPASSLCSPWEAPQGFFHV